MGLQVVGFLLVELGLLGVLPLKVLDLVGRQEVVGLVL